MWKKIQWYVYCFAFGIILGAGVLFAIGKGIYNKNIERLSTSIDEGKRQNTELIDTNTRLTKSNSDLTEKLGQFSTLNERLSRTVAEYDKRYHDQVSGIKEAIGEISAGLTGSANELQSIIEGIEQLKNLISKLPD